MQIARLQGLTLYVLTSKEIPPTEDGLVFMRDTDEWFKVVDGNLLSASPEDVLPVLSQDIVLEDAVTPQFAPEVHNHPLEPHTHPLEAHNHPLIDHSHDLIPHDHPLPEHTHPLTEHTHPDIHAATIKVLEAASHIHSNQALLDTYTETNEKLRLAVALAHVPEDSSNFATVTEANSISLIWAIVFGG